ncbi:MAG: hypothetical protein ACR2FM_04920 [Candidatus Saccharimonadales bacterium]
MAFFDRLKKAVSWINPFDNEEEERRKRQQNQPAQTWRAPMKAPGSSYDAPQNNNQNQSSDPLNLVSQPLNNGINIPFLQKTQNLGGGSSDVLRKAEDPAVKKRRELDELTAANLEAAKKQREQGESFLGRNLLNKGAIERDAEVIARSRATSQFQEKNGWNRDAVVLDYGKETGRKSDASGEILRKQKGQADKAQEIAQWIPGVGSALNLGLAKAENDARAGGNNSTADAIKKQRDKNEFGMSQEEMAALDPDMRRKLQNMRNIGYGAAPLDLLGITGFLRSGAASGLKKAAIEKIKDGAVDQSTKQAIKQAAKKEAIQAGFGTGVGAGIAGGGQQYLTGEFDAAGIAHGAAVGTGTSLLFGNSRLKKAPDPDGLAGIKSVNPNRQADIAKIEAEAAAEQARRQAAVDAQTNPRQAAVEPGSDKTPAYQRQADEIAQSEAELPALRQQELDNFDPLDAPAYQRQGQELPGENPSIEQINDGLRTNADEIVADPLNAEMIGASYRETGAKNPLSLVMHALSKNPDKATVRAIVQRLIPDADGNVLNRATNTITGADDISDISTAITEAASSAKRAPSQPFGAVQQVDNPVPIDTPPVAAAISDAPPPNALTPEQSQVYGDAAQSDIPVVAQTANQLIDGPVSNPTLQADSTVPATFDNALTPAKAVDGPPVKAAPKGTTDNPYRNVAEAQAANKAERQQESLNKAISGEDMVAPVKAPAKIKAPAKTPQRELPATKINDNATTGETGKSQGKYSKGQEYDVVSQEAAAKRGVDEASKNSYNTVMDKVAEDGFLSGPNADALKAIQTRYKQGTPERQLINDLVNKRHTDAAQVLALVERTIRKTATADKLTDRFVSKLQGSTDDTLRLTDTDFDTVIAKNEAFAKARDNENVAVEAFYSDPSEANAIKAIDSFKAADKADRAARFEEYKVGAKLSRKSSNPKTKSFVKDLEKKAGVYTMDWVDAGLLSSSRVMINNFINTVGVRAEEAAFGKAGAALARKFTGTTIGGGNRKGAKLGVELGQENWVANAKLRQGAEGNRLVKSIKNFTTSGNTIGDRNIYAAAYSGIYGEYRVKLKKAGYKGDELDRRAMVNSLADPDNLSFGYMQQALANNAMGPAVSGVTHGKIETWVSDTLSAQAGGNAVTKVVAKALTRVHLGFPTVIARSAIKGSKRAAGGSISALQAVKNARTGGPPETTALHIKNAVKEAGSGATMYAVGGALGAAGIITGAYPTEKEEQERWKREEISEHSIKIGKDYYTIPSALGVFALPFMIGANGANNIAQGKPITEDLVKDSMKTLISAMPIDSLADTMKFLTDAERGRDVSKYLARTGAGYTRAVTPLGSLVNQIAKMFDPTANDTTQGDAMAQFLAKVQDGIPGLSNKLPDKEVEGKVIKNPSAVSKFFGATSTEQKDGVQKTGEIKQAVTEQTKKLGEAGVFNDKIRNILDDDTKVIFDKAKSGKEVSEDDMNKLNSGLTKGITETKDTRFLEDGDYDSNLAVLKAKREMLSADPTTRKDTLEAYDEQITRGEIYKDQNVPYDTIKKYSEIGVEEWRELEDSDPDLYQTLFELDATMTDKGVSRKSSDKTKPKYYAKESRKGRGRGGGSAQNAALKRIQSNTVSSPDSLSKITLGDLRPEKAGSTKMPTIQKLRSSDLIKKRQISVRKA